MQRERGKLQQKASSTRLEPAPSAKRAIYANARASLQQSCNEVQGERRRRHAPRNEFVVNLLLVTMLAAAGIYADSAWIKDTIGVDVPGSIEGRSRAWQGRRRNRISRAGFHKHRSKENHSQNKWPSTYLSVR